MAGTTVELLLQATVRGYPLSSAYTTVSSAAFYNMRSSFARSYDSTFIRVAWTTGFNISTSLANASHITADTSAVGMVFVPPSTLETPYRITASTLDVGILVMPTGPCVVGTTDIYIYTTGGSTFPMVKFEI